MKSFWFSLLLFPLLAPAPEAQVFSAQVSTGQTSTSQAAYAGLVPWHLDRIDQFGLPLDGAYFAPCPTDTPSTVFIVSNGIDTTLPDFGSRASVGYGSTTDLTGNGTYLASLVGGSVHGVDKTANLVSVQGYGPMGALATFTDAMEWIVNQVHQGMPPSVVLIDSSSIIPPHVLESAAATDMINQAVHAGYTVVLAAGDSNVSGCGFMNADSAIVVGATDRYDVKASFSNYGACLVDLFAPGVDVAGAAPGGGGMTQSSTDASAAIVAGAASMWLAANSSAHPTTVKNVLVANATTDAIVFPMGMQSVNKLVHVSDDCTNQVPWHLDRIDQASLPLDGLFTPDCQTGTPTTVYIVGTGIDTTLPEFGNRACVGWGSCTDLNGQGTRIASLVGGSIHGVDKTAMLVSVQVLGASGSGSYQDVVDGLQWIRSDYQLMGGNAVVCFAFGGGYDGATEAEINLLIDDGLTVVVPAGNSNGDSCSSFPAMIPAAITVGATDRFDYLASFTNHGACIDLFAPGVDVETASGTYSGTEFSAAITAGAASLWVRVNGPAVPAAVQAGLLGVAAVNQLHDIGSADPDLLLQVPDDCPVIAVPWHLDRIDQASLPLDGVYSPDCPTCTPTTVYIVGTGIDTTLPELGNRVRVGYGSSTDLNGQGTYVASLVGGSIHGVDKTARLVSVQVLGASGLGSYQDVVAGLEWIMDDYQLVGGNGVVCFPFGGGYDADTEAEIKCLIRGGLSVVVPAGNSDGDACSFFPAMIPEAIAVGATDQDDSSWCQSNHGSCVDLQAPGVDVTGAAVGSGTVTQTGTHASAAIAAGAASLWLSVNGSASPATVSAALTAEATVNAINFCPGYNGEPNLLVRVSDACDPSPWTHEGFALPGVTCEPLLVGSGDLSPGSNSLIKLSNAAPMAPLCVLVYSWGCESNPTTALGGTFVPGLANYWVYLPGTDAAGEISLSLPSAFVPAGSAMWLQWAIKDSAAVHGYALSNAIKGARF